ncbi:hypothetical protein BDF22DRAFT_773797 [Syncephalis plumigaleata]|nr:hypothetical protein BDF22DRAFT_773797 [Syncephalis plumigaleata]
MISLDSNTDTIHVSSKCQYHSSNDSILSSSSSFLLDYDAEQQSSSDDNASNTLLNDSSNASSSISNCSQLSNKYMDSSKLVHKVDTANEYSDQSNITTAEMIDLITDDDLRSDNEAMRGISYSILVAVFSIPLIIYSGHVRMVNERMAQMETDFILWQRKLIEQKESEIQRRTTECQEHIARLNGQITTLTHALAERELEMKTSPNV